MSQTQQLDTEVRSVTLALDTIASAPTGNMTFGDGYKQVGINFSLKACEIAAQVTGYDPTFCKMLNHKFRMDAVEMMFERALAEVA